MLKYDYLVVGAGLAGSVFVHEARKRGYTCLVVDKRNAVGGNLLCKEISGINVHLYGPHIFHTNSEETWKYVTSLVDFNRFTNSPLACVKGEFYNLPFNMNTFAKLWGTRKPDAAHKKIEQDRKFYSSVMPSNMEEQALKMCGQDIYEKFIKGYTTKQWGREPKDLPSFIIGRIPFRFTYDNNYFNDNYQGVPIGGYNRLIAALLGDTPILLNTDYNEKKKELNAFADTIVYTGPIDSYYDYCYGKLEYRSLMFEHEVLDIPNYQGNAVVNYCDADIPYTRIIEHKHFEYGSQPTTVITREYPCKYDGKNEPFYPINDEHNNDILKQYQILARQDQNVIFCGRLAEYKYYNMDKVIESVLKLWERK